MSLLAAAAESKNPKPKPRVVPEDTQQVCIDLPGEEVRCIIHKPKLEIMLRKHRDVIFEIQLFKGMTYTVEADQSDFTTHATNTLFCIRKAKRNLQRWRALASLGCAISKEA